jgi:replicative DNA helicase
VTEWKPVPNTAPASEDEPSSLDVLLEFASSRIEPGSYVLDAPEHVESIWGSGHESLWACGEPFLICGPDGVGKTTLGQQLALAVAGIGGDSLLGLPVTGKGKRVLYLACDRPTQARRSMHRMVGEDQRAELDKQFVIWRGPLPFDIAVTPKGLTALAARTECDVIVIDALKDVAAGLSKDEVGTGVNTALQIACTEGIEVLALHHQRKAQQGAAKPRFLSDVYGSRWITAGCGSVVMLWGDAGDSVVELTHLKQPDETVGPLTVVHDHIRGRSRAEDRLDALTVVATARQGVTAAGVATAIYGSADKNNIEKARRKLERLAGDDKIHRDDGSRGQGHSTLYFSIDHRLGGLA